MTHHGLLRGVILLFTSPDRRVQHFPPGCVLEMGLDTAIPYHYTQTRGEIQHVLNIFFGVLGDYLKTFGLCPRLKPPLPPAPQSSITSSLSQYTQSLLYPSSALQVLGFIITILIHLLSSTSLI